MPFSRNDISFTSTVILVSILPFKTVGKRQDAYSMTVQFMFTQKNGTENSMPFFLWNR